jgi:hypothetical protein
MYTGEESYEYKNTFNPTTIIINPAIIEIIYLSLLIKLIIAVKPIPARRASNVSEVARPSPGKKPKVTVYSE